MRIKQVVVAAVVAVVPLSCYYLEDAEDYPCAEDGSCPVAYQPNSYTYKTRVCFRGRCIVNKGCSASEEEIGVDTTIADHTVCAPLCSSLQPCPTGFMCSTSFKSSDSANATSTCVECMTNEQCGGNCCARGRCITQVEAQKLGSCQSGSGPDGDSTLACDVVRQNCSSSTDKCTISGKDTTTAVNACVATTGSKALGETCSRTQIGSDDCAKGLLCSPRPNPGSGQTHCHQLCKTTSDCASASGTACIVIGTKSSKLEGGSCETKCSVFDTSSCALGFCAIGNGPDGAGAATCESPATLTGSEQTKPVGAACTNEFDCVRGAGCVKLANTTSLQCAAFCDATHPCASGSCQFPNDYPSGLGVCG